MFDIIRCHADASAYGFSRFFSIDESKGRIIEADNLEAATQFKNKKALIVLKDYAFDDGAMRVIAEKKNICFLIDLGRLIRSRGVPRAIAMSKLRKFLSLCVRHNAFYTFASFAENERQIRTPNELVSIAVLLGLNRGQAKFALKMLPHYLQSA